MTASNQKDTHQLALALFQELSPLSRGISDAPAEIGFNRNNLFIEIDGMSLSTRKVLDAAYFIVSQTPDVKQTYEVDLNFFHWLMDYNSRNIKHFKSLMLEAQKTIVQVQDGEDGTDHGSLWAAVQMLGAVKIYKNKFIFEIHGSLQKAIKNPASSHFLSLRVVFNSLFPKLLHDRLLLIKEVGSTPWITLEEFRQLLGCTGKTYDQFKYIQSKVLEPSIKQINEISTLLVEADTKNLPGTKKVGYIRFRVKPKQETSMLSSPMMVLQELYETLSNEIGINQTQFGEILTMRATWTDDRIRQAIEYTRFNIRRGKVTKSVPGYFMRALRDDYKVGTADLAILEESLGTIEEKPKLRKQKAVDKPIKLTAEESIKNDRSKKAFQQFLSLPDEEREVELERFRKTPDGSLISKLLPTHPGAKVLIGKWYAERLWGAFDLQELAASKLTKI